MEELKAQICDNEFLIDELQVCCFLLYPLVLFGLNY